VLGVVDLAMAQILQMLLRQSLQQDLLILEAVGAVQVKMSMRVEQAVQAS